MSNEKLEVIKSSTENYKCPICETEYDYMDKEEAEDCLKDCLLKRECKHEESRTFVYSMPEGINAGRACSTCGITLESYQMDITNHDDIFELAKKVGKSK